MIAKTIRNIAQRTSSIVYQTPPYERNAERLVENAVRKLIDFMGELGLYTRNTSIRLAIKILLLIFIIA